MLELLGQRSNLILLNAAGEGARIVCIACAPAMPTGRTVLPNQLVYAPRTPQAKLAPRGMMAPQITMHGWGRWLRQDGLLWRAVVAARGGRQPHARRAKLPGAPPRRGRGGRAGPSRCCSLRPGAPKSLDATHNRRLAAGHLARRGDSRWLLALSGPSAG
jgi:hypothetical protein